jgi:phosphoglycolate phosphatase-like HAD superfamily hydrolase
VTKVIIHASDSSFGNAALIDSWHRGRGFSTIGYHYVILNGWLSSLKYHYAFDGHLETGRPLDDDKDLEPDEVGAHTLGHNASVGICLIGKSGQFTNSQIDTLLHLLKELRTQFRGIRIFQHSDFEPKKPHCAGLSKEIMRTLRKYEEI